MDIKIKKYDTMVVGFFYWNENFGPVSPSPTTPHPTKKNYNAQKNKSSLFLSPLSSH